MKTVAIIGYPGVAAAFAVAAIKALRETGADIEAMSIAEVQEQALKHAPADFPIYTEYSTPIQPERFNGYMKGARRRRY